LIDDDPVRVKPYPVPYAMCEQVRKEVDEMLHSRQKKGFGFHQLLSGFPPFELSSSTF
jgi:hypothetical protein